MQMDVVICRGFERNKSKKFNVRINLNIASLSVYHNKTVAVCLLHYMRHIPFMAWARQNVYIHVAS